MVLWLFLRNYLVYTYINRLKLFTSSFGFRADMVWFSMELNSCAYARLYATLDRHTGSHSCTKQLTAGEANEEVTYL